MKLASRIKYRKKSKYQPILRKKIKWESYEYDEDDLTVLQFIRKHYSKIKIPYNFIYNIAEDWFNHKIYSDNSNPKFKQYRFKWGQASDFISRGLGFKPEYYNNYLNHLNYWRHSTINNLIVKTNLVIPLEVF